MISTTWNWLWEKHDQLKDSFRFFVKPTEAIKKKSKEPDVTKSGYGGDDNNGSGRPYTNAQLTGLILGPLFFILIQLFFSPEGLSSEGVAILASTIWIATWWVTEAIPIPATSMLPLVLFPLSGGLEMGDTASAYGNSTIFLFLGGFVLALAMERWNLHRRIAISIISVMGTKPERIVLSFMVATGFLSMWISNTATAMMMVPIGLAITYQVQDVLKKDPTIDTSEGNFNFGKAIMLGIGYSASIGGMATLIGTPPNAILAGTARELFDFEISFAGWMTFGVPFSAVLLLITWFYLAKIAYPTKLDDLPGGQAIFDEEKRKLGKASYEEKAVFVVFVLTALAWITRSFFLVKFIPNIDDTVIAIIAAIVLFLIPTKSSTKATHIMDWGAAVKLPWGVLMLFGGGLAIAAGFTATGLSEWIGSLLNGLEGVHIILIILAVTILVNALTEVTSNTATATMMFPIMAGLALAVDVHPIVLMAAAAFSASSAYMLPVATPPNAVVFGSGYLRITDMIKAGFVLNIIGIVLITLTVYFLLPLGLGIDITSFPDSFK